MSVPLPEATPQGCYSLTEIHNRHSEFIIDPEWRSLGAAECLRRIADLRAYNRTVREYLVKRLATDPAFAEAERHRCAEDFVYFATRYLCIFNADARQRIEFLPVKDQVDEVMYPFYRDQYTPLNPDNPEADKRHHMVKKPRKVGASYCVLMGFVWGMCFHHLWPGGKGVPLVYGCSADKKEHVNDRNNYESHMGRMEQMIRDLPPQLLPGPLRPLPEEMDEEEDDYAPSRGRKKRKPKGDTFSENRIVFPENKATFLVKASTGSSGRSMRFRAYLADEETHQRVGAATVRSLMDATSCLWRVSSVNGEDNSFYRDWENSRIQIGRHFIEYKAFPWYDDAWLEVQRNSRSAEDFEQEILCNTRPHTGRAFWYPPWDRTVNIVERPIEPNDRNPLWIGLDTGHADGVGLVYFQKDDAHDLVNCLGMVYSKGRTMEWVVPFILGEFLKTNRARDEQPPPEDWHPEDRRFIESVRGMRKKAPTVRVVTGSDAEQKRMHADSIVEQMRRLYGIIVTPVRVPRKRESIARVTWAVPYIRINAKVNALTPGQYEDGSEKPFTFDEMMVNYTRKVNKQTQELMPSGMPQHNRYSNPADAVQYAFWLMPRIMKRTETELEKMQQARRRKEMSLEGKHAVSAHLLSGLFPIR